MIRKLFVVPMLAILLCLVACQTSPLVEGNNRSFSDAVSAVSADKVSLNDLTDFEWDTMYTFVPYTSKENIEAVIGLSSGDISETTSEGQTQLIFVHDNKVVCSILTFADLLGYHVSFGRYDGNHLAIQNGEPAMFKVSEASGYRLLSYVSE